jgi:hypothetical protein
LKISVNKYLGQLYTDHLLQYLSLFVFKGKGYIVTPCGNSRLPLIAAALARGGYQTR